MATHMRKTFIFYLSMQSIGPDSQPIKLPDGRRAFIRVEQHPGSQDKALDDAAPRLYERVMNTHEL